MKFESYSTYKDCHFPLINQIPEGWSEQKIKFQLSDCVAGGTPASGNEVFWAESGEGTPWVSIADMSRSSVVTKTEKDISDKGIDAKGLKVVPKGTILYSIFASLGKVAEAGTDLTTNQAILALVPKETLGKRFFSYWLQSIESYLKYYATSNTQDNLNSEKVKNLPLFVPSEYEQQKIASFLDHETAKIDTLIEKQQQLIALLKEKRQAVISHAVTKGLNANAPMRDSGVEWLGEVPEHWVMPKIAHVGRVLNGSTPDKTNLSYWENGTIPWLASGCLNSEIVDEPSLMVSEGAYQSCSIELIPNNSLLVGMVGQGKTRGTSAILAIDSCINQNMAAIIPSEKVNVRFLYYLFQAMYEDLRELGRGGNQAALNCEIIGSIRIPLPKMEEQLAIVEMLDALLVKIRNADALGLEQIELLQERRTALISAAVTGKIDVRNWQFDEKEAKK